MVRDPRAALVSYYHHYRIVSGDTMTSLNDFVQEYLSNGCIRNFEPLLLRWDIQVQRWIKLSRSQPVLIVRYEDIVKEKMVVLNKVMEFIGVSVNETIRLEVCRRSDFGEMQRMEERFGVESYPGEIGKRGRFIRKGRIDAWTEEMDPATSSIIEKEFGPVMRLLGYL